MFLLTSSKVFSVSLTEVPLLRILRQGDPIYDYLFTSNLEAPFILVRSKSKINGLTIFGDNFLDTAYADNTNLFLKNLKIIRGIRNFLKRRFLEGSKNFRWFYQD